MTTHVYVYIYNVSGYYWLILEKYVRATSRKFLNESNCSRRSALLIESRSFLEIFALSLGFTENSGEVDGIACFIDGDDDDGDDDDIPEKENPCAEFRTPPSFL